ncbi:hypothetical protein GF336_05555 [Candidatus Woesearchaeota archaeon]|nr:hypothetical protein [Candidatus Woesearchaeota archaeon]
MLMRYKNLIIIGTSHIARQSVEEIEKAFETYFPDIVALELDRKRLYSMTHEKKRRLTFRDIRRVGIKGFLFNLFGAFIENKLGKYVGVKPGSEMMKALSLAKKKNAQLALIDQDIEITLKRISKKVTWKEKFRIVADIFKGLMFRKSQLKEIGLDDVKTIDLSKVPPKKLIKKITQQVKKRYPNLYSVLIDERNNVMASNLSILMHQNPDKKILAVVGAGHEDELVELIKRYSKLSYSFEVKDD